MSRENLEELPRYPLPEGFRFRMFQPEDREAWIELVANTGLEDSYENAVHQWNLEFEEYQEEFCKRGVLVEDAEGTVVAISTAWYENSPDSARGRLHWVGVDPCCQGRGIGKALVGETLRVMATMHDQAMLGTESNRLAAISVYLDFDFLPEVRSEKDKAAWIEIGRQLEARG